MLFRSLNPKNKSHGSSQWRNKNFKPGNALPYGCENFSPATFPQGHTVCFVAVVFNFSTEPITLLEHQKAYHFKVIACSRCTGVDEENCTC